MQNTWPPVLLLSYLANYLRKCWKRVGQKHLKEVKCSKFLRYVRIAIKHLCQNIQTLLLIP